jgi:dipeptidyl aminopeptidase/acylaminoacyl peptidase
MRRIIFLLGTALAVCTAFGTGALAQTTAVVAPNANLRLDGIPAIPATVVARTAAYTEFKPTFAVSWHPKRNQLIVAQRATNTVQLHAVTAPGGPLRQLTDYPEPVRFGAYLPKEPDTLLFVRDRGGNEQRQIFKLRADAAEPILLTNPDRRHSIEAVTNARDLLLVASTDLDKTGRRENPALEVTLLDPFDPPARERERKVATLPGTGWGSFTFSPDDRRLAMLEFISVNESYVWVMDVASGQRTRVLPPAGATLTRPVASGDLEFAGDGKGIFLTTDRDGEFARLGYLDIATGRLDYFGAGGHPDNDWDTESIALSPDKKTLAAITNESGRGVLRLYDAATRAVLPLPKLPVGQVRGLAWSENSRDLAVNINSAQSPGDVYVIDVREGKLTRWTESRVEGVDTTKFRAAEPISWKSFDGLSISGFIVRPSPAHTGKRPVLITIHGGPEGQARPGFLGRWNYFVNELGIAVISPNVRGSTGYGKTFVALDNGIKREDSVKDIGSLLDWIAAQPDLDAARVAVEGGSYGGYMVLGVATMYPDRIAGVIDIVGVANFVSFLENTESYRRDLRRAEYGDERDPAMRAFLSRISPVNNAQKIRAPLLVVHGRNDPRVPYTEAEQIVAAAKKNKVPVWYLLADNEGHGFARKANADYLFYSMIAFLDRMLLKKGEVK